MPSTSPSHASCSARARRANLSGLALPAKGTGRTTPAGNARTRDAAAVSLLRALQRQQEVKKAAR
jgi:hypothetical protein